MDSELAETLAIAQELLQAEEGSPRFPKIEPDDLGKKFDFSLGHSGKTQKEVMDLLRGVVRATPQTSNHRFFSQLFAGRAPMGTAGELLAGMLNISMYTYKVGGPNVLLEWELIRRMLDKAGIPNGDGSFLPGGSLANLVGMVLGRNYVLPSFRDKGSQGKRLTMYVSADGHYSVQKNAGLIGIGRDNCIAIPVDELGRMDPVELEKTIARDRADGALPAVVIATAGTTIRGSVDPIPALAKITKANDMWLHVDAAMGGTLLLHPEYSKYLEGVEEADSITWDAHKMMGVPLTCSALLVRDREILLHSFQEVADYLFQADTDHLNPGNRSIQCARRNDALKLWAAWQRLGDQGWEERIERQMHLARYAAKRIRLHPMLHLFEEPPLATVCFEVPGASSAAICEKLQLEGEALIGYGAFREHQAIRLVTLNPNVSEAEIDALLEAIAEVAKPLLTVTEPA